MRPYPTKTKVLPRAKISDGQSVDVVVPESTKIEAYSIAELDGFLGIALEPVETAAGETAKIALQIEQAEYETSQIQKANAFAKGDKVYWSKEDKLLTTTATGNRLVGVVTNAKDENNVIHFILGPQI